MIDILISLREKILKRIRRFLGPSYERPGTFAVPDFSAKIRGLDAVPGVRLNLGCGRDYRDGWKNVDISSVVRAEAHYDLRKGIPEKDNSCKEIYCSGVVEEILENEHFVLAMNEMWRILQPKGIVTLTAPSARYPFSFRDPFDCRHFIEETWDYLRYDSRLYHQYGSVHGFKAWELLKRETNVRGVMTIVFQPHGKE